MGSGCRSNPERPVEAVEVSWMPEGFTRGNNVKQETDSSGTRVVNLALNQAAKPWFHQYLDP